MLCARTLAFQLEVQLIISALQQQPGPKATCFRWLPPLSFSTSDARGPPNLTFADHPVHVLYKTTEYSLSTAQTAAGAQRCKCAKEPCTEDCTAHGSTPAANSCHILSAASSTAPSSRYLKPPWSAETCLALQRPSTLLSSHFCFLQWKRNSEVKYQRHTTGLEVSSYFDDFIFFTDCCSPESSRRWSWTVRNRKPHSSKGKAQESWQLTSCTSFRP